MTVFKSIWRWIRREAVLSAAILLAAVSAFLVPPDSAYLGYVDYRTLAILFCLMAVMAGLQRLGIFDRLAQELLSRVKRRSSMVLILWGLCFFFSMFITNDVSLITFVPFTMVVLRRIGGETERKLLVPVVVMQTVAANLGSMLTPIGNPQNLYLYGSSGMSAVSFLRLMLPYTLLSLGMLAVWNVLLCRKHRGMRLSTCRRKSRWTAGKN
ncbi:MAG: SLC13 family permease [Ruminococcus sp.]